MTARRPTRVTMLLRNAFTHDTRVEKEARSLTDAGYEVTVIAEADRGLPLEEIRDGYRVQRVARPPRGIFGVRLIRHLRTLERALVATVPDILHAHDSDTLSPVSRAAGRLGAPFVLDAHELWLGREPRGRSRGYQRLFVAYYSAVERRHVPRAAAHITVSEPIARYLEHRYHVGRVAIVPNYPELEPIPSALDLRSLPGGERIPNDAVVVLHIGGAMPGRGVEQLVEAMADVHGADLVMLGPGSSGDMMLERARRLGIGDRVHAIPAVPTSDVIAAAAAATIGVAPIIPSSPNNAASMPNKLFQYLAAGLPVIVSDLPQLRAIVEEADAGVAVDSREAASIAAVMRSMLADREGLKRRGANARRAVETRFNWDVAGGTLVELYRRIRPPGGPPAAAGC